MSKNVSKQNISYMVQILKENIMDMEDQNYKKLFHNYAKLDIINYIDTYDFYENKQFVESYKKTTLISRKKDKLDEDLQSSVINEKLRKEKEIELEKCTEEIDIIHINMYKYIYTLYHDQIQFQKKPKKFQIEEDTPIESKSKKSKSKKSTIPEEEKEEDAIMRQESKESTTSTSSGDHLQSMILVQQRKQQEQKIEKEPISKEGKREKTMILDINCITPDKKHTYKYQPDYAQTSKKIIQNLKKDDLYLYKHYNLLASTIFASIEPQLYEFIKINGFNKKRIYIVDSSNVSVNLQFIIGSEQHKDNSKYNTYITDLFKQYQYTQKIIPVKNIMINDFSKDISRLKGKTDGYLEHLPNFNQRMEFTYDFISKVVSKLPNTAFIIISGVSGMSGMSSVYDSHKNGEFIVNDTQNIATVYCDCQIEGRPCTKVYPYSSEVDDLLVVSIYEYLKLLIIGGYINILSYDSYKWYTCGQHITYSAIDISKNIPRQ